MKKLFLTIFFLAILSCSKEPIGISDDSDSMIQDSDSMIQDDDVTTPDDVSQNFRVTLGSSEEDGYTKEELDALKEKVEYSNIENVGNRDGESSDGVSFKPLKKSVLRVPLPNLNNGIRYDLKIELADSHYLLKSTPATKSKKFKNQSDSKTLDLEGVTLKLNSFKEKWPDEPRINLYFETTLPEGYDYKESRVFIYYALVQKETDTNRVGYSDDPNMLGHYKLIDLSKDIKRLAAPGDKKKYRFDNSSVNSSTDSLLNIMRGHSIPSIKTNGETYFLLMFLEKLGIETKEIYEELKDVPVISSEITTSYKESEYKKLEIPIVEEFIAPIAEKIPTFTAKIKVPESVKSMKNMVLKYHSCVKKGRYTGSHKYLPAAEYLGHWGYHMDGDTKGEVGLSDDIITIKVNTKKYKKDCNAIFWFGKKGLDHRLHESERHTKVARKFYKTAYDGGEVEPWAPVFDDGFMNLNYKSARYFKKDGELNFGVKKNATSDNHFEWSFMELDIDPKTDSGENCAKTERNCGSDCIFASFELMSTRDPENPLSAPSEEYKALEPNWTSEKRAYLPEFFHPQITYSIKASNVLKNGSKKGVVKEFRANYKKADAPTDLIVPSYEFNKEISPVNKDGGYVDISWVNPKDIDLYAVKISWTENNPNPNVAPKNGWLLIENIYEFYPETGKIVYGIEPSKTVEIGEFSEGQSYPGISVY
jgi:hypothetical protein